MSYGRLFLCLIFSIFGIAGALAQSLEKPEGKPMLVISGKIGNTNVGAEAHFDRDMLEKIGLQTVKTSSPWYDKPVTFEGVRMDKLMKLVGATGSQIQAVALNDYVTTIPFEDFNKFGVLLALKRDGKYMPVRDKGPLFIVYPYDSDPQLQSQIYYTRSAWQVAKMIVE